MNFSLDVHEKIAKDQKVSDAYFKFIKAIDELLTYLRVNCFSNESITHRTNFLI